MTSTAAASWARASVVSSPVGEVLVVTTEAGLAYAAPRTSGAEAAAARWVGVPLEPAPAPLAEEVTALLVGGHAAHLDFDLRWTTPFGREVLGATLQIPPGETRSYGWIAREIGRPTAMRAVGTALGRNPVAFFIPCHRVIRGDGLIGEYGYGVELKRRLLEMEGAPVRLPPTW
jgi:O-6-methylguanine DNA methyltransferase